VFPDKPMEAIKNGHGNTVPLTIGSNANEFDLFVPPGTINTCATYWAAMSQLFPNQATQIDTLYDCVLQYNGYGRYAASDVGTDFMFTCPARRIARAALAGGFPSVHRYQDRRGYTNSPLSVERVFHASELPFVFRTFDVFGYSPNAGDTNVSKAYAGYWTRFAANGDPNGGTDLMWPASDPVTDPVLVIDDPLSTATNVGGARCDYWDTIAAE
jgi:para-nitrobenzyl esterase